MAFSKIIVNGTTNLDVTQTTATASDVLYGKTLVVADGANLIITADEPIE
jgi:hypothetical protein